MSHVVPTHLLLSVSTPEKINTHSLIHSNHVYFVTLSSNLHQENKERKESVVLF